MNSRYCNDVQKTHHPLDTRAVVPGAVEKNDFTSRGQVLDITLKIPLPQLMISRLLKRNNPRSTRIQVFSKTLDRTALACGISPLENRDNTLAGFA